MDALGSMISYVREDEQLQLSAALHSEDLSAAHLAADVTAGVPSLEPTITWHKKPLQEAG